MNLPSNFQFLKSGVPLALQDVGQSGISRVLQDAGYPSPYKTWDRVGYPASYKTWGTPRLFRRGTEWDIPRLVRRGTPHVLQEVGSLAVPRLTRCGIRRGTEWDPCANGEGQTSARRLIRHVLCPSLARGIRRLKSWDKLPFVCWVGKWLNSRSSFSASVSIVTDGVRWLCLWSHFPFWLLLPVPWIYNFLLTSAIWPMVPK